MPARSLAELRAPVATYGVQTGGGHATDWVQLRLPRWCRQAMVFNRSTTDHLYVAVPGPTGPCEGANSESADPGTVTDTRAVQIPPRGFRTFQTQVTGDDDCSPCGGRAAVEFLSLWGHEGVDHPWDITCSAQSIANQPLERLLEQFLRADEDRGRRFDRLMRALEERDLAIRGGRR